jgi:hypothetical protein
MFTEFNKLLKRRSSTERLHISYKSNIQQTLINVENGLSTMNPPTEKESGPCDCDDDNHRQEEKVRHRHTEDECLHEDGSKHKIHSR